MNYSIFRFTLNMHNHRSQASVSAFRGDTAIRLYITITDGGTPYYINDGCSAILCGTKADGTKLFNRCVIENNAVIRYDFTEQTTSCIGVANCEITLYDEDGDVITAPKFVIVVDDREASYESIVESHSERDALDALMVSARGELERVVAENVRVEAEAERVEAETERAEAETARKEAEKDRVVAENARVEAEAERVEAETERAEAVTAIVEDVTAIVEDVTEIVEAETARVEAETNRVSAEKARVSAENERVKAEKARVKAEAERSIAFKELSDKIENMTTSYSFDSVSTFGIRHDVPTDAMPYATLDSIGGYTRGCRNLFWLRNYENLFEGRGQGATTNISVDESGYLCFDSGGEESVFEDAFWDSSGWFVTIPTICTLSLRYISGTATGGDGSGEPQLFLNNHLFELPSKKEPIKTYTFYNPNMCWFFDGFATGAARFSNYKIALQLEHGTTATEYEPYFEGLKSAKVTAIKSYGANLCQKANVTTAENMGGRIDIDTVKKHGTYTLSCDITKYAGDTATNTRISITVYYTDGTLNEVSSQADQNSAESDGITRRKTVSITTNAEKVIDRFRIYVLNYSEANNRDAKAENICFCFGTDTEYKPYFVDTYTVPKAVQELEGYGLGGTKYKNIVNFAERTYTAYEWVQRTLNGDEEWVYAHEPGSTNYNKKGIGFRVTAKDCFTSSGASACTGFAYEPGCLYYEYLNGYFGIYSASYNKIDHGYYFRQPSFLVSNLREWKDWISFLPLHLMYALNTPDTDDIAKHVTDVAEIIPYTVFLKVEGGGYIVAENDEGIEAPITMTYLRPSK